jgi:hypothetical protein
MLTKWHIDGQMADLWLMMWRSWLTIRWMDGHIHEMVRQTPRDPDPTATTPVRYRSSTTHLASPSNSKPV